MTAPVIPHPSVTAALCRRYYEQYRCLTSAIDERRHADIRRIRDIVERLEQQLRAAGVEPERAFRMGAK